MKHFREKLVVGFLFFCLAVIPVLSKSIHQAVVKGDLEMVKKWVVKKPALIDARDKAGRTPLHLAALKGNKDLTAFLLKKGADINLTSTENKRTALHYAAWKGHGDVVALLLKRGADIEAPEKDGETPIYYAAAFGDPVTVKILLKRGAKVKGTISKIGSTPMQYAVYRNGGNLEVVKMLEEAGTDMMRKRKDGWNYLHFAAWGAKTEIIAYLLEKGIPAGSKTDWGWTPLHGACQDGNREGAILLIKNGAPVNAADKSGRTPLSLAVKGGNAKMTALLLKTGAKPGDNLFTASYKVYGKIAHMLIEAGADVNGKNKKGKTPLYYAMRYGHKKVAKVLLGKGAKKTDLKKRSNTAGLLKKEIGGGNALVWYLGHSGWAVKTQNHFLVFDYFKGDTLPDTPMLANGHIDPQEIKDLKVTVFSSHSHGDHYMPAIFDWQKEKKDIRYVLGFQPKKKDGDFIFMGPREKRKLDDMKILTLESNDSGVAFFVLVDGVKIFHSGDHANRKRDFSGPFKKEIDWLAEKGLKPDLFFAPVSGCGFGDQVAVKKGVYYTIKKLSPRSVFPMHAGGGEERLKDFALGAIKSGFKTPMCCAGHSGDLFYVGQKGVKGALKTKDTKLAQKGQCKKSSCKAKGK